MSGVIGNKGDRADLGSSRGAAGRDVRLAIRVALGVGTLVVSGAVFGRVAATC